MKAIVLNHFGGLDALVIKDIPTPSPLPGQVLIQIKAFGINHAEMHMRRGEWAEAAPVSGIECVGIVAECPSNEFQVGEKVAALMGGMGRSINGSYAEYTCVPATNVVGVESGLKWEELAVLPESFATAWTCLFRNLELKEGQRCLIRGATSSFGLAAVGLAISHGVKVVATTRNPARFDKLKAMGVEKVILEEPNLSGKFKEKNVDAVLDLIGNSTIVDSLRIPRRGGRICLAGWLSGLDPIREFNPLLEMASGVHWSFFGSFVFGTEGFPVSDVPLQKIAELVEKGEIIAKPARVFKFEEIREAHRVMEANEANGKLVVVV